MTNLLAKFKPWFGTYICAGGHQTERKTWRFPPKKGGKCPQDGKQMQLWYASR